MALDQSYLDAIKGFEGYAPNASWDFKQYSSGYGTRAQPGDENIPPDQRQALYEQRFQNEVGNAASSVDSFAPNLPAGVKAALTSLTYNAGPAWQQSGLGEAVKAGDFGKARDIFLQYNKAGGEVNPGLVSRRSQEAAWFGGGLPQGQTQPASASPASQPMGIPQGQAPIFPQQTQQQPAQQAPQQAPPQSEGGGFFGQMPAEQIQAPPIHYAQRRPVDLTALRNALASREPIFPRG